MCSTAKPNNNHAVGLDLGYFRPRGIQQGIELGQRDVDLDTAELQQVQLEPISTRYIPPATVVGVAIFRVSRR